MKTGFSMSIEANQTKDGVVLDFDYLDSDDNDIKLTIEDENYLSALATLYGEVTSAIDTLEQEEEEPEELTEEQKYIKELEEEIDRLHKTYDTNKGVKKYYVSPHFFPLFW